MKELISIIVPIYNAEKYLKRCLDSILNQSYQNIEIILINDASTDRCDEICEQYSKQYSQIKYLKNSNQGVSESRNIGIEIASGSYITFVDSDDYIEKDHIETLVEDVYIYKSDVIVGNYRMKNEKNINIANGNNYNYKNIIFPNNESKLKLLQEFNNGKVSCYVWRLLVKREKLDKFDKNIKFWEDKLFYIKLLLNINSIYFEKKITYNYFRNNESCTMKKSNVIGKIQDIIKVNNEILEILKCNGITAQNLESDISKKNLEAILYFILKIYEYNVEDKHELKLLLESGEMKNFLLKINKNTLNNSQKVKYFLIKSSNTFLIYLYYIVKAKCKNKIKEMIEKK